MPPRAAVSTLKLSGCGRIVWTTTVVARRSMKTIVFLDFDDVLAVHPEYTSSAVVAALKSSAADQAVELWENVFHPTARANLRTLNDEFEPRFVISSSWATYLSREHMCEIFTRCGLEFVAAALHPDWRSAVDVGAFRVTDISRWIQQHEHARPFAYVILDDVSSGQTLYKSPLQSRTVFCSEWQGFIGSRLTEAQIILRTQLSLANGT